MRMQDLKIKFHELMIQHSLRHSSYLDVAKSYYKIWEMPSVQEDQEGAARVVSWSTDIFLLLTWHRRWKILSII
jgi:26S proteasome regulatory subunit N5